MHPAYSVILFTTASGAGYGLLAMLGLVGVNHGQSSSMAFGITAMIIALGLVTIGLLSSTFHLGRPERAWRAFSQWRTSWLSREGVAAVLTYIPALLFGLAWTGLIDAPNWIAPLGVITAVMAAVTVVTTGMIYASLKTIRAWNHRLTVPVYLALGAATGACLLGAIAVPFGRFQVFQAFFDAALLLVALVLKYLYWRAIDSAPLTHTMESATGLGRIGKVSQWEQPHSSENYIQKEMGFAVARKHAEKLRSIVLLCLLAAAALSLLAIPVHVFAIPAAAIALAATAVERWLFFAEAKHVVTLFYGEKAA